MSAEAFSVDGVKKLEDLGIHEAIVAFSNPYEESRTRRRSSRRSA
jgi:hypothetical protein